MAATAPDVRLVAHRGFAGRYPENTLAAVRRAARRADVVEVDVRRCGSGELVVVHDPTVDRVTDGTGPVAAHSLSELAALDVLDTGDGVPTLAAILDAVPRSVTVNVELKESGTAADALAVAADADREVLYSSFDADALRAVGRRDASAPLAYIFEDLPDESLETARALDCTFLHPHHRLCVGTDLVERAHAAGLGVNAWTVRDRDTARRLAAADVDGLIADRRDVAESAGAVRTGES